jgi:hypothetical protein
MPERPQGRAPLAVLADTGIAISSPQDYDLMAGLLLDADRGWGEAAPAQITRRAMAAPRAEPPPQGRRGARRRSPLLLDSPLAGLRGTGTAGRPQ